VWWGPQGGMVSVSGGEKVVLGGGDLNRGWAFGGVVTWWGLEKVGMSLNVCWVVFRHDWWDLWWVWVRKTTSD
jgi:hypothetical protein